MEHESPARRVKLIALIGIWEIIVLILFALFVEYDHVATPTTLNDIIDSQNEGIDHYYPMLQDVHVMIFVGFGFLLTFLKKYGFSGVGMNFLLAALSLQWTMLVVGFFHSLGSEHDSEDGTHYIQLNVESIITGDFGAGAVLISFGAVMGKLSPLQLFFMMLIELPLYGLNEYIGAYLLGAVDMGGSIFVHTFGAYFGLAFALTVTNKEKAKDHEGNGSSYTSDMFAMVGTLFLWMFWPSFNGALALGAQQHRVVINTVLALSSSCIFAYLASFLFRHEKKFDMVDIQNATLAGGVAVGSSSDLVIQPWAALLIGAIAGILSVIGYVYVQPFLEKKIRLFDTAGINNLHGMPGIMGSVGGAISALAAGDEAYGESIATIFSNRAPVNATLAAELGVEPGLGYTASQQMATQFAALGITLAIAIVGGLVTGVLTKFDCCDPLEESEMFEDEPYWETPSDYGRVEFLNKTIMRYHKKAKRNKSGKNKKELSTVSSE